jgi:hypothetical protein
MTERNKASVLIAAIVVVLLFVLFQMKGMLSGGAKPVADNTAPPAQHATPTPAVHVDANPLSNGTTPTQSAPPQGVSTAPGIPNNKVPNDKAAAASGPNFATGSTITPPTPGADPFRKVLVDKNKPGGTSAPKMAQQTVAPERFRPGSMPGGLPMVNGFKPMSPGPVSPDAFMLKGIVSDRTGPIAVVKDGEKTVYISPGTKVSSGLILERVGNGYAIFSNGTKNFKVMVGGGLGSGA